MIKNLKNISATATRAAVFFAERFTHMFDQVIGVNPAIITNEEIVVWNASPETVAEARQLIQAFDGMKDKITNKRPAEILDTTVR